MYWSRGRHTHCWNFKWRRLEDSNLWPCTLFRSSSCYFLFNFTPMHWTCYQGHTIAQNHWQECPNLRRLAATWLNCISNISSKRKCKTKEWNEPHQLWSWSSYFYWQFIWLSPWAGRITKSWGRWQTCIQQANRIKSKEMHQIGPSPGH